MDDFLFLEHDWLYQSFERLEFVRSLKYYTFKAALNLLVQRNVNPNIVETGTMRMKDDPGGCSTLLFGAFAKRYGAHLWTVDINPSNMAVSRQETRSYSSHITYCVDDSVAFLKDFPVHINFLYLDSMDCQPVGDSSVAQQHQLEEFKAAEPHLSARAILLMDDNDFPSGGKTKILKEYLLTLPDWECIMDLGQSLWQRVG